jgi:thiol-disulfide isomerase/thioredoxin
LLREARLSLLRFKHLAAFASLPIPDLCARGGNPRLPIHSMPPFLAAFLVALLAVGMSLQAQAAEPKQMALVPGKVAAPLTQLSDGKRPLTLAAFKGHYVLVNFWATWCSPCVQEMPALDRLAARMEKQGLKVVAVSQDEGGPAVVRPFAEKLKLSKILILYDAEKRTFRDYGLRGLPTTVLLSPEGKVLARLEGSAVWDEGPLAAQVASLVKK